MEEVSRLADDGLSGDPGWIVLVWMVGAVLVGRVGAGRQARVRRTADLVDEPERGRGAAARLEAARTREELASELHDSVARHAPGSSAEVRVTRADRVLRVEGLDRGSGRVRRSSGAARA